MGVCLPIVEIDGKMKSVQIKQFSIIIFIGYLDLDNCTDNINVFLEWQNGRSVICQKGQKCKMGQKMKGKLIYQNHKNTDSIFASISH